MAGTGENCVGTSGDQSFASTGKEYIMYKQRWIGMGSIWLLNISTGLVWLTFSAVPEISSTWFHTGMTSANLSVVLYFIGTIVASTFSGFVFEKFGIKRALMLGGVINVVGTWIRFCAVFVESSAESSEGRLAVALIGQFIASTAQPFFLNAPPKLAAVWFSESSRAVATATGTLSNPVGAVVAMLLIPAICSEENGSDMPLTLLVTGIVAIGAFLSTFLTSDLPPTAPSASAAMALADASNEPFWRSIRKISAIGQFWILFFTFSVFVGLLNTFISLINQIVGPYGYSDEDGGLFVACMALAGIPATVAVGILVDRTRRYIHVFESSALSLCLSYVALALLIGPNGFWGIAFACMVLGISSFPLLPVALELGIECTYPIPPSCSTSTLWMGGQLFGVVFLVIADALRDENGDPPGNMYHALVAAGAVALITSVSSFFYHSPNHRLEAEKKAKESRSGQ